MHQRSHPLESSIYKSSEADEQYIDLERLAAIAWRRAGLIALFAAAGLVLGIVYLLVTPPTYTAATRVLIDEELAKFVQEQSPSLSSSQADAMVLSEVEIMQSERLARSVAIAAKLNENEAFLNPPRSPLSWLKAQVRGVIAFLAPSPPSQTPLSPEEAKLGKAAALLQQAVNAERVGRSFVIELTVRANDPVLAGTIARTYAEAYLSDQLDANFDATQRATVWLQDRLDELRQSSQAAALEVERYRAEHGLTAASGKLISEQQLTDLNSQLILAQAETANARARYNQFKSIIESGAENAVRNATIPSDQPNSQLLTDLKARYLSISTRERDISERFGEDHAQAVALRREKADIEQQIYRELEQLTETYRNEYEVARSREESLRANLGLMKGESSETGQSLVKLRELEQKATALSTLYQNYLSRYEEASQLQSLPIAKARVISAAANPISPSSPRKSLTLAFSLVLGLFAGAGVAALQEFRERFFRTGEDVRSSLGFKFLGYLPKLERSALVPQLQTADTAGSGETPVVVTPPILRAAIDQPASPFAETLRNARLSADVVLQDRPCKVLGFVSVLPREGKTTTAANFAALLAAGGAKTLLIDADLRNPGLSRELSVSSGKGLVEAIIGERWQSSVRVDRSTKLAILPATRGRISHTSELLASPGMHDLVEDARQLFHYIIVDLPPLGPVIDAKAFEPLADGFILVSEWGETPRALVRTTMQAERRIAAKVLGVVLNKTDMKKLPRYADFGGAENYLDHYAAYYGDQPQAGVPTPQKPMS
ncbi:succinoglycan biosynthesis transport protein ExoP [Mesorhizobium sp. J18]|uniref:polysaccharide biosynthesis tyrosine autokinase n=1 Tax=Mesorhizobium sp. J18 TaxID=935263 RepID=UPI001199CD12|nr:polysaccharide biosynthesis tyrosine autokinase [Mesorhizobium sp. J18]TWG93031.1 succinoglycan biosynthesis transport protein ExoP [Mesorhizobium sp. J18]